MQVRYIIEAPDGRHYAALEEGKDGITVTVWSRTMVSNGRALVETPCPCRSKKLDCPMHVALDLTYDEMHTLYPRKKGYQTGETR